ncbi:uncharacterized protein LOC129909602 [Episyrphus balteatus]|uniref:uncharacterized protein LOC129909602 n=1 Tax=Episyrphus balteatus TaxID=286459 RepID=UPI00248504CF|nr:uncharacterized protein LOC129909602 [Episyrphus balteatus]
MAKVNCLFVLWILVSITQSAASMLNNNAIAQVVLYIIREHLSNLTSTIALAEHSKTPETENTNTHLLDFILQNLKGKTAVQFSPPDYYSQPLKYYVFIVDSPDAFRIAARSYPPYFVFAGNTSHPEPKGDWENISGLEGYLLKILALTMNFTIDLLPFSEQRSYAFRANQTYGCFKQLHDLEADIAVGAFWSSNGLRHIFSPTVGYHSSTFIFVARGKSVLSSLGRLAKPFTIQLWILVLGFLLLIMFLASVLKMLRLKVYQFIFGKENHNPVTNMLAVFLGQGVSQTPRRNFARYILFQMLLLSLVLRSAYEGSLYDAFRKDNFDRTPSGIDDLIKLNYTLLLTPEVLLFIVLIAQSSVLSLDNKSLSEVALYIIRERLSNLTSTIVLAEKSKTSETADTNTRLLNFILQNLQGKTSVQFYLGGYSNQPLEYYVFIIDSLEAFKDLYQLFADTPYERHFRFLIILTNPKSDFYTVMEEIFILCYNFDVIDANILTAHPTKGVHMFTYYLFSEEMCRRCVPILMYNFNEGFENFGTIFPRKLTNFHGCPFKVAARSYPPYFTFVGNTSHPESIGDWENMSGIEGTLLKFLAETLNFTIDLQPFQYERSYVKDNQSYGCLQELEKGVADIAVGGFIDSNDERWLFSPTYSYHTSSLLFVVRGKYMINSLRRLAKPFSTEVWCLVSSFFVLTILFLIVLKMVKRNVHKFVFGEQDQNPVTNFIAIFLGYPIRQTPRRNFARYIFLQFLLLTLVLRNAYQGSLYDAFRKDRFAQAPSGFRDLLKWNYTLLLPPGASQLFYLDFPNDRIIVVESTSYDSKLKILEELEGKFATVGMADTLLYYFQTSLRNGTEITVIPENINNYQFVMFLPKHSIYLSGFNKKIKELAAIGMMAKLGTQFTSWDPLLGKYLMQQRDKVPLRNKRAASMSNNNAIAEVVLYIIREHLSNLTSTIALAEHSKTPETENTNTHLLDFILQNLKGKTAVQFSPPDYYSQPLKYYVFIVDSPDAFRELYQFFKNTTFERHFRFLIILTNPKSDFYKVMEEIFKLCYNFDVIDVNIIIDHPTEKSVQMFTYYLFWESNCHGFRPRLLYNFNEGFDKLEKVFPKKLKNFHKCPIRIAARSYPPYFVFAGNTSHPEPKGDWENISGLEGYLLKILALTMNFTIDLLPFSEQRSYAFRANQTYGCFKQLHDLEADIAVGAFWSSNGLRHIFSPTVGYHSSTFIFVARGKSVLSSLGRLAKPFTIQLWILVLGFLLLIMFLASVLKMLRLKVYQFIFGKENHNPVTNLLAVFLGYAVNRIPRRNFARYILFQLLLLTLILRSAYQGFLYDAFRKDKFDRTPSGIDDLIKLNYTLLLTPEGSKVYKHYPKELINIQTKEYKNLLKMLERSEKRYTTLVLQDRFFYHLKKNVRNRQSELLVVPEIFNNFHLVMVMRKHSIYLSAFNKKLKDFAAAGILSQLSIRATKSEKEIIKTFLMRESAKVPLHNARLSALYSICGLLIGVSLVVFCLEILSVYNRMLQKIFD